MIIQRIRTGVQLLRLRETWSEWWMLAYAVGNILQLPYEWLERNTIQEK